MEKQCNVVILPTEKASGLYLDLSGKLEIIDNEEYGVSKPQHLYITSDEEIKKGDWVYDVLNKTIYQANSMVVDIQKDWKKIIATTDESLNKQLFDEGDKLPLPKPSPDFVKYYVDEYSKGNVIDKVMVEYVLCLVGGGEVELPMMSIKMTPKTKFKPTEYRPKLRDDNTIITYHYYINAVEKGLEKHIADVANTIIEFNDSGRSSATALARIIVDKHQTNK